MRDVKPGPVIPTSLASMRSLTVTMTVMCYLASLAIGALIMVNHAVDGWTMGLAREVTVQIRETQDDDMELKLAAAIEILKQTKGIASADVLDREAGVKLLEPWLGKEGLEGLPVPRLIRVTIAANASPDYVELETALKTRIKGAVLDTHRRWAGELTRMAGLLSALAAAILALIAASAIAMVIYATRAVLDANRLNVEVLRLVGAKDGYIARQIDRLFLRTGLWSGFAGLGLGILTFAALAFSAEPAVNGLAAAARDLLYLPARENWQSSLGLATLPLAATLIAMLTSRYTLMRMLKVLP
jgi:cell division transport system permease protein